MFLWFSVIHLRFFHLCCLNNETCFLHLCCFDNETHFLFLTSMFFKRLDLFLTPLLFKWWAVLKSWILVLTSCDSMNKYSLQLTKFFVLLIIMIEIGRFKRTFDKHFRKTLDIRLFESMLDIHVGWIGFNWPFHVLTYPSNIKNGGGNIFFTTFPYVRMFLRIQLQRKSLHGETVTFEKNNWNIHLYGLKCIQYVWLSVCSTVMILIRIVKKHDYPTRFRSVYGYPPCIETHYCIRVP